MDHLPPLSRSSRPQTRLPLLCSIENYHTGEFAAFPAHHGWAVSEDALGNFIFIKDSDTSQDHHAVTALVQAWLFFGTLNEVFAACGIMVELRDFVNHEHNGELTISTTHLPSYLDKLNNTNIWSGEAGRKACDRIIQCFKLGSEFIQRENVLYNRLGSDNKVVDMLVISIQILGETLENALRTVWASEGFGEVVPAEKIWSMKSAVPGRTGMSILGGVWCRTEKIMLYGMFDTTTLYYAGSLYRPSVGLEHSACGNNHCMARQIDNAVYRTKHATEGCKCGHVLVDTAAMRPILARGSIPCIDIAFVEDEAILTVSDSESRDYVAISHVWSDGLGNTRNNSLPLCQLRRLSSYIIALSKDSGRRPLLWIDTLCVPLIREDRDLALALLGDVYEKAMLVLVLDSSLLRVSAKNSSLEEQLLYICLSGWMRRLWTLNEGVLGGPRTRFQFLDNAITLPSSFDSYHNTIASNAMKFIRRYLPARIQETPESRLKEATDAKGRQNVAIMTLFIALQYRTTSRLTDETLCVGPLLGEDISTLVPLPTIEDRMVGLITMLQKSNVTMPPHILFCGGEKLQEDNFRWAPVSFMQMGTVDGQWLLESLNKGGMARIDSEGLVCRFAGLEFDVSGPLGDSFAIQVTSGWCRIMPRTLQDTVGMNRGWEETKRQLEMFPRLAIVLSSDYDLFGVLVAVHNTGLSTSENEMMIRTRLLCEVYVFWESGIHEQTAFEGKRIDDDQLWCVG
ncbi:hypothetical protein BP6252_13521 [Coleophoma cylindrospora]|uniref:Heterokaryon incompatibility domain-containing protein n=1 Tax=Coleophoma cylindrospora TaxID=1849047 RepID=A0A3D8Q8W9_9HELO|nr:hypothetical protein BP6252_13521 [Coleophoma cylindrospora]